MLAHAARVISFLSKRRKYFAKLAVDSLLFIKSHFTTNAQNVLHLNQSMRGHFRSWNAALFQKSQGSCEWFDKHKKCAGEVSSFSI
jgi:hypothetical protein